MNHSPNNLSNTGRVSPIPAVEQLKETKTPSKWARFRGTSTSSPQKNSAEARNHLQLNNVAIRPKNRPILTKQRKELSDVEEEETKITAKETNSKVLKSSDEDPPTTARDVNLSLQYTDQNEDQVEDFEFSIMSLLNDMRVEFRQDFQSLNSSLRRIGAQLEILHSSVSQNDSPTFATIARGDKPNPLVLNASAPNSCNNSISSQTSHSTTSYEPESSHPSSESSEKPRTRSNKLNQQQVDPTSRHRCTSPLITERTDSPGSGGSSSSKKNSSSKKRSRVAPSGEEDSSQFVKDKDLDIL